MMESFWFWFVKPLAELAYVLSVLGIIVICALLYATAQEYIKRFKAWKQKRTQDESIHD